MKDMARSFLRHPSGMLGLAILLAVIALAIAAPLLYPGNPWDTVAAPFTPPRTDGMLLGSDSLGRDIAAGIAHGTRVSLMIGVVSTLVALLIGVVVGALSGYLGGRIGELLMRFTELFQTIPAFLLAILLVAILTPSIRTIVIAIAVVSWPQVARLTRGEFLALKEREFVQAARCQGECPRNPDRIVGGCAAVDDALAVASWTLTAGALIAVAVALSFRMRTAPAIGRFTPTGPVPDFSRRRNWR